MRLIQTLKLKDLVEYERLNNRDILKDIEKNRLATVIDLIMIGNKLSNREDAYIIYDKYINEDENNSLYTAIDEVVKCLTGGYSGVDNNSGYIEDNKRLSDIIEDFNMELMSYGISYSEFWNMDVNDMYRVACGIVKKLETDINISLQKAYIEASMNAQAIFGKLPDKPPIINMYKSKKENIEILDMHSISNEDKNRISTLNARAWALSLKIREGMI